MSFLVRVTVFKPLAGLGIQPCGELLEKYTDRYNRLGNLQLLPGAMNLEKLADLPADWLRNHFPSETDRRAYCMDHHLIDIPEDMSGFLDFYQTRREKLHDRIAVLINTRQ